MSHEIALEFSRPFSGVRKRDSDYGPVAYLSDVQSMNRLDEVVGIQNWWNEMSYENGAAICRLSVRLPGGSVVTKYGISRWDEPSVVAGDHETPFAHAFVRAAASFGIGRDYPGDVRYAPIKDFPGYKAGDDGSLWSQWVKGRWKKRTVSWRKMKQSNESHGYLQASIGSDVLGVKRPFKVHGIIARAFYGPMPEGLMIRHLNGDRKDNRIENLAYGTAQENAEDTVRHGRTNRGEKCPASKLTEEQVVEIKRRLAAGEKQKNLAKEFGVHNVTINGIAHGRTWAHVAGDFK